MYLGIIINIFPAAADMTKHATDLVFTYRTAAYFVAPLLAVAVIALGYWLGVKNKKIFGFVKK